MQKHTPIVISAAALVGLTLACTAKSSAPLSPTPPSSSTPADGSTLKASAPVPQSPINDQKLTTTDPPTLVAGASTATFAPGVPLQYHFQVFNANSALVADSGLVNGSNWQVNRDLDFNSRHTWWVRAEYQGNAGPWSAKASFFTPEGGFVRNGAAFDPLTNGKSVGQVHGGTFIPGQGWQALTYSDGIDYDVGTCTSCRLEFDVTNIGKGLGNPADLKFVSMGDAGDFGSFQAFRDGHWKMQFDQRGDGDGTAMEIIWREYDSDHRQIQPPSKFGGIDWQGNQVYHMVFDWTPDGFSISVNGDVWFTDGFEQPYAPPNLRISLGCYPRNETQAGGIWRNVKLTSH